MYVCMYVCMYASINNAYYQIRWCMRSCLRSLQSLRPRRRPAPNLHHPCYYSARTHLSPLQAGAGSGMEPRLEDSTVFILIHTGPNLFALTRHSHPRPLQAGSVSHVSQLLLSLIYRIVGNTYMYVCMYVYR